MSLAVTLAVLAGAFCHAAWNAIVRGRPGRGDDKLLSITLLITAAALVALPGLAFAPVPDKTAWPFLAASVLIHTGYNTFLALAYRHGDLGTVYPLARGSAPLATLAVSTLFVGESVDASAALGIVLLAAGIMALAFERGWRPLAAAPHAVLYAAATSLCITAYTLSDGLGARRAGSASGYIVWLFVLEALPLLFVVGATRGREFVAAARSGWRPALIGGTLSLAAYWIAIWAMTVAPIPLVAALRETSILFAVLIGIVVLGERAGRIRLASIPVVLAGLALIRL